MRRTLVSLVAVAALTAITLHAANQTRPGVDKPRKAKDSTLFDRLGGMPGINALMDDFANRIAADGRINAFFARADMVRFKQRFGEQVCQLSGGPCVYGGPEMLEVHRGMGISGSQFQAMMEDLIAALKQAGVAPETEGALLGTLLPMKPDILEKP